MPFYGDESGDRPDPYRKMTFGRIPKVHESDHLRAKGNLSYLDFLRLLEALWKEAHPDIPLYATGTDDFPTYPCVVYSLEMRRPFQTEPKARTREEIRTNPDEDQIIIYAQRFDNIVAFKAYSRDNPQEVEEIIESFEDFMVEYTPVFKQLGLSDISYAQRLPDGGEPRAGRHVIHRTVAYKVVTEKITQSSSWKLRKIVIDAQKYLDPRPIIDPDDPDLNKATPDIVITDLNTTAL